MPAVDRHHRNVRTSQNKENQRPNDVMSPFRRTNTSPEVVQTPVKKDADDASGRDWLESLGVAKHPWGVEVKNTFIHYGSPLKTLSVVTPPKTVPANFAPEKVFLDKLTETPLLTRTPLTRWGQANTPSTVGVGFKGTLSSLMGGVAPPTLPMMGMPIAEMPQTLPQPPALQLLRRSEEHTSELQSP